MSTVHPDALTYADAQRIVREADCPVHKLNLEVVGGLLVSLVCSSSLARHRAPRYTARDYLHPQTPEEEFVVDMLTLSTTELDAKWFKGQAVQYGAFCVEATEAARRMVKR